MVESQIDDGTRLLAELSRTGFDVTAALWAKPSEEVQWSLYIVSKTYKEQGPTAAYRWVYETLQRLPGSWISLSDIKLLATDDSIARDILAIRERRPGRIPIRYPGSHLGNVAIDGAYCYPLPPPPGMPLPAAETMARMFELLQRQGIVQPAAVTLRDGSAFQGVPFGVERNSEGLMNLKFIDMATSLPRMVSANEVTGIE